MLYRMMLPYAHEIVCREQGSFDIARRYTDKLVLYHDWAIDVIDSINQKLKTEIIKNTGNVINQYILINFIPKHTNLIIITQFLEWMQNYSQHQIINFPAEE